MRAAVVVLTLVTVSGPATVGDDPPKAPAVLRSSVISPPLQLPDAKQPVYGIGLDAELNAKGDSGKGTLTLHLTPPSYDEYGDFVTGTEVDQVVRKIAAHVPPVTLECRLSLEKVGFIGRVNQGGVPRSLYKIEGPKVRSNLYYATTGPGLTSGRLLIRDKDDHVQFVVEMTHLKPVKYKEGEGPLPVPCHPGCFPAGTLVRVPGGTKRVEFVRAGNVVTTIGRDGTAGQTAVQTVFTSTNRLFEIRTDSGKVVTTAAQPLCLVAGGFRPAGELKAGDRIWRWSDGRRTGATIREVIPTGRTETVYNLIVGESAVFVAGDFLARGKPPAPGQVEAAQHLDH
jgi:hypothetical protein